jgi:nucleotide-binding universal stress UspA family protein
MLHVLEHAPAGTKRYGREVDSRAQQQRAEERAARELEDFVMNKVGSDVRLVPVVRSGSPPEAIKQFTEEEGIDLIVMATHGRTGLRHILMGSVAEKVVRISNIPVLTVKPRPLREAILENEDIESELHLP